MEAWCKRANEFLGTSFKLADLDTWASWRKLGISRGKFFQFLDEAWDDWKSIPGTEPSPNYAKSSESKAGQRSQYSSNKYSDRDQERLLIPRLVPPIQREGRELAKPVSNVLRTLYTFHKFPGRVLR